MPSLEFQTVIILINENGEQKKIEFEKHPIVNFTNFMALQKKLESNLDKKKRENIRGSQSTFFIGKVCEGFKEYKDTVNIKYNLQIVANPSDEILVKKEITMSSKLVKDLHRIALNDSKSILDLSEKTMKATKSMEDYSCLYYKIKKAGAEKLDEQLKQIQEQQNEIKKLSYEEIMELYFSGSQNDSKKAESKMARVSSIEKRLKRTFYKAFNSQSPSDSKSV